jgi:threonine dehydrogenase-like Zn-dependent dehydrogenase
MKALCRMCVNDLSVEKVPEPKLINDQDIIVKIASGVVCGPDLHLIDGCIPGMRPGDNLGHEFLCETVETGPAVAERTVSERVAVSSIISCGRFRYCCRGLYSACDKRNVKPAGFEQLYGYGRAGVRAYSHLLGGCDGWPAAYVRVPCADLGASPVPDVDDDAAVFVSYGVPAGWMATEVCDVQPGHVVAVWDAGEVSQLAAVSATLPNAAHPVVRLHQGRCRLGSRRVRQFREPADGRADEQVTYAAQRSVARSPLCLQAARQDSCRRHPDKAPCHASIAPVRPRPSVRIVQAQT